MALLLATQDLDFKMCDNTLKKQTEDGFLSSCPW